MPTYEYQCLDCEGVIEEQRVISQRRELAKCECGGKAKLTVSLPQQSTVAFIPGADMKQFGTGKIVPVDGLLNKSAPKKRK
jgi:putative FmdB family regulatory protein